MPGGWTRGGGQIPFDNRELLICALDHKPADRILTDRPANLASEFLYTRHVVRPYILRRLKTDKTVIPGGNLL